MLPTVEQFGPIPVCPPTSYFLDTWILLLLSNEPIETAKMKMSKSSLGLQQPSRINLSSQMELFCISVVPGTRRALMGREYQFSIENDWLPPVHESASCTWTLNCSKRMNKLIILQGHMLSMHTHAPTLQQQSVGRKTSSIAIMEPMEDVPYLIIFS